MRNLILALIFAAIMLTLLSSVSYADTVQFSTFGPGQSFQTATNTGWSVYDTPTGFQQVASSFAPTATFTLTQIDVAASYLSGPNQITVELLSNAGGTPGSVIESWTLTGLPQAFNGSFTPEALTAAPGITLMEGTTYWLELLTSDGTVALWNYSPNITGTTDVLGNVTGPSWVADSNQYVPAYDVQGTTAAPEPSALPMLSAGIILLGLVVARRGMPLT